MPELPEVETLRRDLAPLLVGRRVTSVTATGLRSVRRTTPSAFETAVTGRSVTGIDRHGKYLLVRLADPVGTLIVHLRMSGQVLVASLKGEPPVHTHVHLGFGPDLRLWFVDPRTFGELWVSDGPQRLPPEMIHLGPDALIDGLIPANGWPTNRRVAVKALLLDQTFVAGIGNIYADEICHRAGIRVDRSAGEVSRPAQRRLAAACAEVLEEAVAARGSTLGDGQYVDAFGRTGEFAMSHRVHAREGQPCVVCGRPIQRLIVAGRSAYQCRRCQR